jgi:hypothetical protein
MDSLKIDAGSGKRSLEEEDDDIIICQAPTSKENSPKKKKQEYVASTRALEGKSCVVCGKTKSPSQCKIPIIQIGKFRKLKICKKQHLREEEANLITKIIQQELDIISSNGDTKRSVLIDGSEEETVM